MKNLLVTLCFLLGACGHTQPVDLAIRDATVVDVTDGSLVPGQALLVEADRIVAIGPVDTVEVPAGAEVLQAEGGYLVPGLWDAHVHSATSIGWHFPLYIAHGITSVRNMHTSADDPLGLVLSIKRRVAERELLGPRFLANGAMVDGDPPVWPGSVVVRNAEEARAAVDRLADGGADFIKVYDRLNPEASFAILERAKQHGIPVDGHLPFLIPPEEAAAAGQRTIEHTSGMKMGCASRGDALRADYVHYLERLPEMPTYPDQAVEFLHRELERLTEAGLSPLEALKAATLLPARVFRLESSLGTVEVGKLADLVLLEANPLEAISNTRRIRSVISDGRLFRRADLDRLLAAAALPGQQMEKQQ